ncbi:MAG: MFS transporter [Acidobacteria bacterium]|jgi:dipeptide/tripeptide permease|nr:MFS transporter [Acidobacteriota bacterium]
MTETTTWRFPATFWIANSIELFERAAYYGTFIALALFLSRVVGFTDVEAGWIGALFSSLIYFLPFLTGAAADRVGFRRALLLAFALLSIGYASLGLYPTKLPVLVALALVVVGGSFVKPIITGTVAKSSDSVNRARAYSLFYMMVNIGSFTGKTIAKPVRVELGLDYVPLYSAGAAFIALLVVALFYWPKQNGEERPRSAYEALRDMRIAMSNLRFLGLILITAGFWAIQGQLYASMPKYVLRLVGEHASPEWYANVNPLVVVLLVVPVTQLIRRLKPVTAIGIALLLISLSPLTMSMAHFIGGRIVLAGYSFHPITIMMVIGIAIQGFAECFLSPRYLEYASKQAPPGQEGLYLGYAHMNTFFAWLFGFILSGYLLEAFCPDPRLLAPALKHQYDVAMAGQGPLPAVYAHAHYIWFVFAGIGFTAFLLLLLYQRVTSRADARHGAEDR